MKLRIVKTIETVAKVEALLKQLGKGRSRRSKHATTEERIERAGLCSIDFPICTFLRGYRQVSYIEVTFGKNAEPFYESIELLFALELGGLFFGRVPTEPYRSHLIV